MQDPFRLGEWQVEPARRLLRGPRRTVRLEPKSLAVLCTLAAAAGAPVSRQGLIDTVWCGRLVSDDAVTRQVAKLRRALGDDPRAPTYIETIPKTGFRLLPPVLPAPAVTGAPGGWRAGVWLAGVAAALAGLVLLGVSLDPAGPPAAPTDLRQLTAAPGLEVHPFLSPSGRAVVYAARAPGRRDFDLYVQDAHAGPARRLTEAAGHDLHPAWSPDGERIAYIHVHQGACTIRLHTLYDGRERPLTDCRAAHEGGGLSWAADGGAVYFADHDGATPFELRRVAVADGTVSRALSPVPGTLGDQAPRVAVDGRIAFLRTRTLGVEDVYVLEPDGTPRRVTFDDGKIHGLAWRADRLVLASNRGGGLFGLWQIDPRGRGLERLPAPTGADAPAVSVDGRALVFERWSSQVDLYAAPLTGGEPVSLQSSTRWDWWPAASPDGTRLAWTSDRSGAAELWVAAADGRDARRLTRFAGPYTQDAVWTPDGTALVVAAPAAGQFDLFRVDAATGTTRRLTETPEDEAAPVFAPDGRLLFRRDGVDGPALVDRAGRVVLARARLGRFGPDGALWFTRPGEPGLWRLAGGRSERMTDRLETVDWRNWWVDEDGVYLIERPAPDAPRLARLDPGSRRLSPVRELPGLLYRSGLTRLGDRVVYARTMRQESDLYALAFGSGEA